MRERRASHRLFLTGAANLYDESVRLGNARLDMVSVTDAIELGLRQSAREPLVH